MQVRRRGKELRTRTWWWQLQQQPRREDEELPAAPAPSQHRPSQPSAVRPVEATRRSMARPAFQLLPKPCRFFSLLGLTAFALLLEGRAASAAPLQGNETPMAKIYPRGSHWAVGHFMGKKSTGEFPYIYEEQNAPPLSSVLDEDEPLGDSLHWGETFKQFLRLLEGNESQSAHILREEVPFSAKGAWEAEDKNRFKEMMDSLLQMMDRKETTPS